jgi:hypothetical protein
VPIYLVELVVQDSEDESWSILFFDHEDEDKNYTFCGVE